MLIPLGTDRPLRRKPVLTYVLIGLCTAVFAVQSLLQIQNPELARRLVEAGWVSGTDFRAYTLLTSAFLHGGLLHLAGNMLFLFVFGPNLEDRLGRLGYLGLYLGGAAASAGLHAAFSASPAVGASGAIAALTGAYLVMFPRTLVRVFSLIGVVGLMQIKASWFIGLAIVFDIASHVTGRSPGVAHLAHLGGYIFGVVAGVVILGLKLVPREPYDLFSAGKQALRRRELKAAVNSREREVRRTVGAGERSGGAAPADEARTAALAAARAAVTTHLAKGELEPAARAYRELADRFADIPGAAALSRKHQYDLANYLYSKQDHPGAAFAYERLIEAYPRDPETPQLKLLLGTINARYLNDPIRAKALLNEALSGLHDDAAVALAKRELEALG